MYIKKQAPTRYKCNWTDVATSAEFILSIKIFLTRLAVNIAVNKIDI